MKKLPINKPLPESGVGAKFIKEYAIAQTRPNKARSADVIRDRRKAVTSYFEFTTEIPTTATTQGVTDWLDAMSAIGLSENTIHRRWSFLNSFFKWVKKRDGCSSHKNPCDTVKARSPKPYGNSTPLDDSDLRAILDVIKKKSETATSEDKRLVAKRDYAIMLFFVLTGHRREEVIRLTVGDLKYKNDRFVVKFNVKGGDYLSEEVDVECYHALTEYFRDSGRMGGGPADTPVWVGHGKRATGKAMSSYTFAKNLKAYAIAAGVGDIHIHQLRHTYARMIADKTGDLSEVSTALGHKNLETTRSYLNKVTTKKNKHSDFISAQLDL